VSSSIGDCDEECGEERGEGSEGGAEWIDDEETSESATAAELAKVTPHGSETVKFTETGEADVVIVVDRHGRVRSVIVISAVFVARRAQRLSQLPRPRPCHARTPRLFQSMLTPTHDPRSLSPACSPPSLVRTQLVNVDGAPPTGWNTGDRNTNSLRDVAKLVPNDSPDTHLTYATTNRVATDRIEQTHRILQDHNMRKRVIGLRKRIVRKGLREALKNPKTRALYLREHHRAVCPAPECGCCVRLYQDPHVTKDGVNRVGLCSYGCFNDEENGRAVYHREPCSVEPCDNNASFADGKCTGHHYGPCSEEPCDKLAKHADGKCDGHHYVSCSVERCDKLAKHADGKCSGHHYGPCSEEPCDNLAKHADGKCSGHHYGPCSVTTCGNRARGGHGKCNSCHHGRAVTTRAKRGKRGRKKIRTMTVLSTDPTRIIICCVYNCGKEYETLNARTRGVDKKEWNKTLQKLREHEQRVCKMGPLQKRKRKKMKKKK
jgi:hypothetical protein